MPYSLASKLLRDGRRSRHQLRNMATEAGNTCSKWPRVGVQNSMSSLCGNGVHLVNCILPGGDIVPPRLPNRNAQKWKERHQKRNQNPMRAYRPERPPADVWIHKLGLNRFTISDILIWNNPNPICSERYTPLLSSSNTSYLRCQFPIFCRSWKSGDWKRAQAGDFLRVGIKRWGKRDDLSWWEMHGKLGARYQNERFLLLI